MLSEKLKEVKTSVNRMYTRFMTLTAVVVFGAIAIAQAQREDLSDPPGVDSLATAAHRDSTESAQPIPASKIALASAEGPIADEESSWAANEPAELSSDETESSAMLPPANQVVISTESAEEIAPTRAEMADDAATDTEVATPRRNPMRGNSKFRAEVAAEPPAESPATEAINPRAAESATADDDAPPLLDDSDRAAAEPSDATEAAAPEEPAAPPEYNNELPAEQPATEDSEQTPADDPSPLADEPAPAAEEPAAEAPRHAPERNTPRGSRFQSTNHAEESTTPRVPLTHGRESANGRPGPQAMEGPQVPTLTLEKTAPAEVQVGRPAKFQVRVRNTGRVAAENVVIRDEIPAGANLVETTPKATRAADGAILWELGTLAPGQEATVIMQLMPVSEGQLGSVATVAFQASASARTRATKPELQLEHSGPVKALVGDAVRFAIKLTNPGSGTATQVVLEEEVPEGLSHSSGPKLVYEVGAIQPGQTRHLELTLKAAQAGHVINTLTARADSGLTAKHEVELDVVAPQLKVAIEGPAKRYLERQATYTVSVANPGTADARDVELIANLPTGLKFVSTNNSGFYDQARHAVIWSLEQLPAGEMGKAQFTATPIEMGEFLIKAEGHAATGLEDRQEHTLHVEGIAALLFGVADKVDPIEVGGQTTYEIRVVNQGSKAATNVRFVAIVPDGLTPVGAEGPSAESVQGQQIQFAPLDRLPPKEQALYRITVEGTAAGDHRFRVQMTSDEIATPVIKEESTRVYAD